MTDSTRREAVSLGAMGSVGAIIAAAAAAASEGASPPRSMVWEQETCGGCGAAVYFLPGQRSNKCGQPGCGTKVAHR